MSNDTYGFDTGIRCPNCEESNLHSAANSRRECPHCGYSEPNDPVTKTTSKDHTHG